MYSSSCSRHFSSFLLLYGYTGCVCVFSSCFAGKLCISFSTYVYFITLDIYIYFNYVCFSRAGLREVRGRGNFFRGGGEGLFKNSLVPLHRKRFFLQK